MKPLTLARKAVRAHARVTRATMLASGLTGTLAPLTVWGAQAMSLVRQRNEAEADSPEYARDITIPNPLEWALHLTGAWHWLIPTVAVIGVAMLATLAVMLVVRLTRTRHDPHKGDANTIGGATGAEPTEPEDSTPATPPDENTELPPGAIDDYGPELD